ncbi:hypothetical protein SIIN_3661_T [Serendipita indica DSM 11827]|nr:hypothetical protein SIIN_3661_T [Serendipita indica DSM 11827]
MRLGFFALLFASATLLVSATPSPAYDYGPHRAAHASHRAQSDQHMQRAEAHINHADFHDNLAIIAANK